MVSISFSDAFHAIFELAGRTRPSTAAEDNDQLDVSTVQVGVGVINPR
jgi:hypothetical protein